MNCERTEVVPFFSQEICTDVSLEDADNLIYHAAEWVAGRKLSSIERAVVKIRDLLSLDVINQQLNDFRYFGSRITEKNKRYDAFYSIRNGRQVVAVHQIIERQISLSYISPSQKEKAI